MQNFDLAYKDYEASLLIDKILENIEQNNVLSNTKPDEVPNLINKIDVSNS